MSGKLCPHCGKEKPLTEFHKRKERGSGHYQAWCKECKAEGLRKRRQGNPERAKERDKLERIKYATDRKKNNKIYKKTNRVRCTERQILRYHKNRGNGGSFTKKGWEDLKAEYNYRCPACKRKEPEIKLTVDHIVPIEKGGSSYIDNIQPLCGSCNSGKGTKVIKYVRS